MLMTAELGSALDIRSAGTSGQVPAPGGWWWTGSERAFGWGGRPWALRVGTDAEAKAAPADTRHSLDQFFIANPSTPVFAINLALSFGQNLLLTPGRV